MPRTGRPRTAPEARFFAMVREDGACWTWTGNVDPGGYGTFWTGGGRAKAHRWSYEFFVADIPHGLQLDHLCRNRGCVNPWHLEPVTARVNTLRSEGITAAHARRTTCLHGHPLEQAGDRRVCRTCRRAADRRYKSKERAA